MNEQKVIWYQYPSIWTRKLYAWVTHWAETPFATPALFLLAFAESSFFPIPPDVLLIALAYGIPEKAYFYALICSLGSVLGGVAGYFIGFLLWEAVDDFFFAHIFSEELFNVVRGKYEAHSFWIIFTAAFTPIPYKIFTITAGVSHIPLLGFVIASLVGRSLRFFLVAFLFHKVGGRAREFIEMHFEWLTILFALLIIAGFFSVKYLF